MTHNLVGLAANLSYLLEPSAKKLACDLDPQPWSWPAKTREQLLEMAKIPNNQAARNNMIVPEGRGRKRKILTFSELTDAVIENEA